MSRYQRTKRVLAGADGSIYSIFVGRLGKLEKNSKCKLGEVRLWFIIQEFEQYFEYPGRFRKGIVLKGDMRIECDVDAV